MKIAIISPTYPPYGGSGIGSYTMNHSLGLKAAGHEVTVFTWLDRIQGIVESCDGIIVNRLPNGLTINLMNKVFKVLWLFLCRMIQLNTSVVAYTSPRNIRGALTLLFHHKKFNNYDIIEAPEWGGPAALLFRFIGNDGPLKVIKCHASLYSHFRTYSPQIQFSHIDLMLSNYIEKKALFNANIVLSPSKYLTKDIKNNLHYKEKIFILPNGIYPFSRNDICENNSSNETKFDTNYFNVTFSGRFVKMKGAETIINIIKLLSNQNAVMIQFNILGNIDREYLNFIKVYQNPYIKIQTFGEISQELLFKILKNHTDCFLFPSYSENFPLSILEAMFMGIPVIASRVGGIVEIIDDGINGILCECDNHDEFAKKILYLSSNSTISTKLGRKGHEKVMTNFSSTVVTDTWLKSLKNESNDFV